ncbi:DUF6612 family protein [Paenibacillus macerans]|uniref:DUF6612 family protein n=1 Tax=Paenibacillus macerans TaxID=44252 RepID=UPI003D321C98
MRRWTVVLLGVILAFGMTACGQEKGANGAGDGGAAQNGTNNAQGAGENNALTLDELIQKTMEASDGLNSFSMEASVNQNISMTQGDQKQDQKVDMTMKIDTTKDPLEMYQEIQMSVPGSGNQEIKQYITDEGVFSNMDGNWMKLPDNTKDQLLTGLEQSVSPEKQLEQFKSIAGETKVTEEGDEYVLTAEVSGDGVKELAKSLMDQSGSANEQTAAMMEQMNIKDIKITYAVNKETFFPTKSNIEMTLDMEAEGQSVSLEMKMNSTISKHNELAEIKVPQEVLDSAA